MLTTEKVMPLIDEAMKSGRVNERERCVLLAQLVQAEIETGLVRPEDWLTQLIYRIQNPKA